jgi:hypothetical protein
MIRRPLVEGMRHETNCHQTREAWRGVAGTAIGGCVVVAGDGGILGTAEVHEESLRRWRLLPRDYLCAGGSMCERHVSMMRRSTHWYLAMICLALTGWLVYGERDEEMSVILIVRPDMYTYLYNQLRIM